VRTIARGTVALVAALLLPACGGDGSGDSQSQGTVEDLGSGQPPFIRIVSPGPRTSCQEGATVTLQAIAVDPNAILARVDFFDGDKLIGSKYSAPFLIPWGGMKPGTHVLTAVATDIEGITAVSDPVTVFVEKRGHQNGRPR
jgi:hypothetical protein